MLDKSKTKLIEACDASLLELSLCEQTQQNKDLAAAIKKVKQLAK